LNKIQRLQKRLGELIASQDKHLKKAHEIGVLADKLKKEILIEENNAIATKIRELGLTPENLDKFIVDLMKQQQNAPAPTAESAENLTQDEEVIQDETLE